MIERCGACAGPGTATRLTDRQDPTSADPRLLGISRGPCADRGATCPSRRPVTSGPSWPPTADADRRTIGTVPYQPTWELQDELADQRRRRRIGDRLLLLEHFPVYTIGRGGDDDNLLAGPERLA